MAKRKAKRNQKFAKNASSKQPAMLVYVKDWLSSAKLRRAGLDAKGLWADFLFLTSLTMNHKEYGVFTMEKLDSDVTILLNDLLKQKDNQNLEFAANLLRNLILQKTGFCSTFEDVIGTSREKFSLPLSKLLLTTVCKINDQGYLYSSRMVRDADLSEKRARAGSKGGEATQAKIKNVHPEYPESNGEFATDFAKSKGVANVAIANAIANTTPYNNNTVTGKGSTEGETFNNTATLLTPDAITNCYSKSNDEIKAIGVAPETFSTWKEFVDLIATHAPYRQAFVPKFVFPKAFATLFALGFTRDKWEPVLSKLCGLGLKPEQDLFFRIQDALNWPSTFAGKKMETAQNAGLDDDVKLRLNKSYHEKLDKAFALKHIEKEKYDFVKARLRPGIDVETLMKQYEDTKNKAPG